MGTFETYDFIYRGYARAITIAIAARLHRHKLFSPRRMNHVGGGDSLAMRNHVQNKIPVAARVIYRAS